MCRVRILQVIYDPVANFRLKTFITFPIIINLLSQYYSIISFMIKNLVNSTKDYPLIASAFNITTMLLIHLHIYTNYTFCPCCGTSFKTVKKVPLKEMAAFAFLLEENSWQTVFNELFSIGVGR